MLVEQQVRGLDVAVQHAARVRVLERRGNVAADARSLRHRQERVLVEHRAQRSALEQLEHHERHVVVAPVVDGDDVGMVQRGGQLRLGPEAAQEGGVLGQRRVQHLHRHPATQAGVVGDVDATARAGADGAVQQVPTREHTAREVAHRTAGHGFNGSGRPRATRVTSASSPFPRVGPPTGNFICVSLTRPKNPMRVGDRRRHRLSSASTS